MADYKEMYLTLFRATEEAVNLLIAAQQKCEKLYVTSEEPKIVLLSAEDNKAPDTPPDQLETGVLFPVEKV